MSKMLVNAPSGLQELIEIGPGGGYFDPARIVWDERIDGILPEITLGGMIRIGNSLVLDNDLLAVHQVKLTETITKKESDAAKAKLNEIDLKSIRGIREYVAKQPDAPEYLKNYEAEFIAERLKIRGKL